jgi:nitroreductase
MEVKQAIQERHSVRHFTDQGVDADQLKEIIAVSQKAPSWVNSQPQKVYVAQGDTLKNIREQHQKFTLTGVQPTSDVSPMSRKLWSEQAQKNMAEWSGEIPETLGDDWQGIMGEESSQLYNAQAVVYLTLPKGYAAWSLFDLGAFSQNILLSATEQGINSIVAYNFVKFPQILRDELQIPDDEEIIVGIGLGFEDEQAKINQINSKRMAVEAILKMKN